MPRAAQAQTFSNITGYVFHTTGTGPATAFGTYVATTTSADTPISPGDKFHANTMYFNLSPNSPFGIQWTGNFYAPYSGTYTFTVTADDGFRFNLSYAGNSVGSFSRWDVASTGPVTNTYQVTLTAGTTYAFGLDYFEDGAGGGQISLSAAAPTPPSTPLSLNGYQAGGNINLYWNADPLAAYYPVYRAPQGGAYTLLANSPTNTYTDTSGTPGVSYYYLVYAYDSAGNHGPASNYVLLTFPPPVPAAPLSLSATPGNASVALAWTAPAGSPTSYNIKRSLTTGGPYSLTGSAAANSYTDSSVTNRTNYYYVVSAVNASGEGSNSTEAGATPDAPDDAQVVSVYGYPATMTSGNTASATVTMRNIGTATWPFGTLYDLGMISNPGVSDPTWGSPGYASVTPSAVARNGTQTFTVPITAPAVTASKKFPLQFQMFHSGGAFFGDATTPVYITVTPAVPAAPALQSPITAGNGSVTLVWTAPPGPVSKYQIAYSQNNSAQTFTIPAPAATATSGTIDGILGPYSISGSTLTFTVPVTGLSNRTNYYFSVRAVNDGGPGPASNVVGATPDVPDDAQVVSISGYPATMISGQTATATVVMRNIGTAVWPASAPYHLGMESSPGTSDYTWGPPGYANAGSPTVRNGLQTFTMPITAPVVTASTQVPLGFQMFHEPSTFFGDASEPTILPVSITVTPPPTPVIGLQIGDWQPKPALINQTITAPVTASVTANPYQSPSGDSISQHWAWTTGGVYGSADGSPGSFTPASDYAIGWSQGSATTQFNGSFSAPGYYIVEVTATLTYHDDTTGQDVCTASGSGYIGGSASDLASSGSSTAPANVLSANVLSAHQALQARSTGTMTVDGIAVATPTISLSGTTPDAAGNLHILIGQQCSANLSNNSGNTASNIQWSVSGNTIQQNSWNPAPDDTSATFSGLVNPYTFTQATPQATGPVWYWDDSVMSQTVTCTATMTPPAGQGAPFSVTATQKVTLDSPTYTQPGNSIGNVLLDSSYGASPGVPALHAGDGADKVPGIIFNDRVAVPALYTAKGYWYHVQLISVSRYLTPKGKTTAIGPLGNLVKGALDSGPEDPGGVTYVYGSDFTADGTAPSPVDDDSPGNGLSDTYQEYNVKAESFQDFVMYQPAGANSISVPLESFTWSWNADVKIQPAVPPPAPASWSQWGSNPTNGTITPPGTATRILSYPTWSSLRNFTFASP